MYGLRRLTGWEAEPVPRPDRTSLSDLRRTMRFKADGHVAWLSSHVASLAPTVPPKLPPVRKIRRVRAAS